LTGETWDNRIPLPSILTCTVLALHVAEGVRASTSQANDYERRAATVPSVFIGRLP